MFEIAHAIRTHITDNVREMLVNTLNEIRKLEYVRDAEMKRAFLSGKLEAYEEIERLLSK